MSVLFSKTFEMLNSNRYDKQNIILFAIILTLLEVIYCYYQISKQGFSSLIAFIISIFLILFCSGYYVNTTVNEINNRQSIFPALNEISAIIINGFKYQAGLLILYLPVVIPLVIIFASICAAILTGASASGTSTQSIIVSAVLNIFLLLSLVLLIILVYSIFVTIPLSLMYIENLKFSSFFKFSKIKEYLKNRKGNYAPYLGKWALISIINIFICIGITILFAIINVTSGINIPKNNFQVITMTVYSVITGIITTLLLPNLTAQFIMSSKQEI